LVFISKTGGEPYKIKQSTDHKTAKQKIAIRDLLGRRKTGGQGQVMMVRGRMVKKGKNGRKVMAEKWGCKESGQR